ncbi:MAG: hypothetical protein RQ767_03670 [Thermovirgaceae bacterium]|nr:hypothetical protein [Thermovirgaceae bacterium]
MVVIGTSGEAGYFYRYLFAALCFSFLAAGILMQSPTAFLLVLLFGSLSRVAKKRSWPDPPFAEEMTLRLGRLIDKVHQTR